MYDRELGIELLSQIYQATQTVIKRFGPIKSADDFIGSEAEILEKAPHEWKEGLPHSAITPRNDWRARPDSNGRPTDSKSGALSS